MTDNETPPADPGLDCLARVERSLVDGQWQELTLSQAAELQRARDLAIARGEVGADFDRSYGPGSGGIGEIWDRTHVAHESWERYILDHPSTLMDGGLYLVATQVSRLMGLFYRMAGEKLDDGVAE